MEPPSLNKLTSFSVMIYVDMLGIYLFTELILLEIIPI